jgi:superfamily I DNA/RNA helicase
LRDFYSNERQIPVNEQTLVLNHRSSANILTVAAKFLEGDKTRHPKALQATRPQGLPGRLGDTAEERHLNEERRLAHVAATRAKNRLVFTSFNYWDRGRNMESQFCSLLSECVIVKNKDE